MNARYSALLVICLSAGPIAADDSTNNWKLVWQDEFNGQAVDTAKWSFEVNGRGGGNRELQYYTTNNAQVRDGRLLIQARKENFSGPDGTRNHTSARIRTKGKGDWHYGRFETRAKMPKGQGLWPAFWMMPTDSVYGGWPRSGEIDIMEYLGHQPGLVHGTLHYAGAERPHESKGAEFQLSVGDFASSFHVFRLDWDACGMKWFVDGALYQTQTNWPSRGKPFPAPFDQRFHIILNLAVGGNWPGAPDASTTFPQDFEVDYVRVYQRQ